MIDKYLATEMLEFNSLSQFSVALFIYHRVQPCDLCQGQSNQGHKLDKTGQSQGQGQEIWHQAKTKD